MSSNTSRLEARVSFFRLLMKGIFGRYVLWPFDKKLIFQLVTCIRTRDYTVTLSSKIMSNNWQLATTPILWVCFGKNVLKFVSPAWKLENPYCHSLLLMPCQQMVPNKLLQKSVRSSQLRGQSCNLESVSMNYFLNKSWNIIT